MELALAVSLADVSGHRLYLRNTAEQPVLLASLPQYTNATYVIKRLLDIVVSAFRAADFIAADVGHGDRDQA